MLVIEASLACRPFSAPSPGSSLKGQDSRHYASLRELASFPVPCRLQTPLTPQLTQGAHIYMLGLLTLNCSAVLLMCNVFQGVFA